MHETTGGRDFHRRGGSVEIYAFDMKKRRQEKKRGQDRGHCGAVYTGREGERRAVRYCTGKCVTVVTRARGVLLAMTHMGVTCDVT